MSEPEDEGWPENWKRKHVGMFEDHPLCPRCLGIRLLLLFAVSQFVCAMMGGMGR